MTKGSCIPIDSVKSDNNYSNIVHNTSVEAYTDLDKINPTYLVG